MFSIRRIQYIPRNMHTVFALLCFVVVIHWLIFPYPSGLLHWHWGNLTIAPVPAKQPWWIWINTSCEFITNDCITTTKQSTTKSCAYYLGYTVRITHRLQLQYNARSHHCMCIPLAFIVTDKIPAMSSASRVFHAIIVPNHNGVKQTQLLKHHNQYLIFMNSVSLIMKQRPHTV